MKLSKIVEIVRLRNENAFSNKRLAIKATLLFYFVPDEDFREFEREDILQLKLVSLSRSGGKYVLPDEIRTLVLTEFIGIDNFENEIKVSNIKNDFTSVLLLLINSNNIDYNKLSLNELFYCSKLINVFPDKLDEYILTSVIQRKYFFSPFERITKHFSGRKDDLKDLANYVDWLPKSAILGTISFFRNIINCTDKPPLLISGVGGVGKSALISKFIIDHTVEKKGKILPIVYIDFDMPGFSISEPLNILLEGLRQLSIQFPSNNRTIQELLKIINEIINTKRNDSSKSSRTLLYEEIKDYLIKKDWNIERFNTPVLAVFDSFEEMQYRANREEIQSFFQFLNEVASLIPRFRPIIIGRSDIRQEITGVKFEPKEIKSLDIDTSNVLLEKLGVNQLDTRLKIFNIFGGNPLMLHLAANLVMHDMNALNDVVAVIDRKHEFLVSRIMDHVHDPDVRKVAVPGMVLRFITPEIIKEVLAVPCGLKNIDTKKAEGIFAQLKNEAALIISSENEDELYFRQDLRKECRDLIKNKYLEEAELIQEYALRFFKEKKEVSISYETEYYYHVLRTGKIPEDLDLKIYNRIRSSLDNSIEEFPNNVIVFINTLLGQKSSDASLASSDILSWENHFASLIKIALNGEINSLYQLEKELAKRNERSNDVNSEFPIFEALLYQRLNKIKQSNEIIEEVKYDRNALNFQDKSLELEFIKAQNFDYLGDYEKAMKICNHILPSKSRIENEFLQKKYATLANKLEYRCEIKEMKWKPPSDNLIYKSMSDFNDTYWISTFAFLHRTAEFKSGNEIKSVLSNCRSLISDRIVLEQLCRNSLGMFLHDIALQGEPDIILQDFLWALEIRNKLDKFMDILEGMKYLWSSHRSPVDFLNIYENKLPLNLIAFSQILNLQSNRSFLRFNEYYNHNAFYTDEMKCSIYSDNEIDTVIYPSKGKMAAKDLKLVHLKEELTNFILWRKFEKTHREITSQELVRKLLE